MNEEFNNVGACRGLCFSAVIMVPLWVLLIGIIFHSCTR
jgi:hypothetical protein